MQIYKTEGIIIKRRNFNEADRILTVFTKTNGKMQVKAPGVRKVPSRRSPHVELLNHSTLSLHKGKSMPILTEAQTLNNFSEAKEDLLKVGFAYHICELIDGLCADHQENQTVFYLLKNVLESLSKEAQNIAPIIHEFEIALLTNLGFYPRNQSFQQINTVSYIESILERRLRSRRVFQRLVS